MNTINQGKKAFTVLVGVDHSELSTLAITEAIAAARTHEDSHIHVVHVVELVPTEGLDAHVPSASGRDDSAIARASEALRSQVEKVLADLHAKQPDDGRPRVGRVTTHVRLSDPRRVIPQLASDLDADLVVVGTHGRRGLSRLLLGSVAEGVVRLAPCPVLVVRPREARLPDIPEIEPPCPQCVETRRATSGTEFWCARHSEHHARPHTYHMSSASSGHQSGFLIPIPR